MVSTTKELKVKYTGDVSGVKSAAGEIDKVNQGLASKMGAIGKKMQSVGKSATLGLTLPIVAAGAAAFNLADEWGDATATLQQHIKTMGASGTVSFQGLTDHAQKFAVQTGVAATEIVNAQGKLATFANVADAGTDTINRATDAAVDLSASGFGSIGSASVMLGKALDNPVKGLTALTRVGVSFSDQQAKVITHLVDTGKTAKAQGMILQAVESQVGGTAAKIADPWDKAKVALQNAGITIGTMLAPVVAKLSGYIADAVAWFQHLSPQMQKVVGVVLAIVAAIGPLLIIVGKLMQAFELAQTVMTALAATNPFILIAIAVVVLVVIIIKNWSTIKKFLLGVWHSLTNAWNAVWNKIKAVVGVVVKIITTYIRVQVAIWSAIIKTVWAVAKAVWNAIWTVAKTVWNAITSVIRTEVAIWKAVINAAKAVIIGVWNALKKAGQTVWNAITGFARSAWDGMVSAARSGANIIIGLLNSVINGINAVINGANHLPGPDIPTIPNIPTLARGGTITRSGVAWVGERGPEMVTLNRGATVHPAGSPAGVGAITINVAGSVLTERDLADVVQRALLRKRARNGTVGLS